MTQGIGSPPPRAPALSPLKKDTAAQGIGQLGRETPSLAQFSLNQTLQKLGRATEPASEKTGQEVDLSLRSLTIFRDADSGKLVTLYRDEANGRVTEQLPDERVLEFYSRLGREIAEKLNRTTDGLNLKV